jgi:hypothetical protein
MHFGLGLFVSFGMLLAAPVSQSFAGVYYSGETIAELPSQWRGFLIDQRSLRALSIKSRPGLPDSPLKAEYSAKLKALEKKKDPSADEIADQGALYIRLGLPNKAVEVLKQAQHKYPKHFRIAANLGTAWQLSGDLEQAAASLRQAVAIAPEKFRSAEQLHLKLVQLRRTQKNAQQIDDLFGVKYGTEVGSMPADELKKLPADAVAQLQRLALALPADARLLWQLGELANAHGDIRTAASIFDGCVSDLGLTAADFRQRRQVLRAAADKLGPAVRGEGGMSVHEGHASLTFRSPRPLIRHFDSSSLPAPNEKGATPIPWALLAETNIDARGRPHFADYLKKIDGKSVSMSGFLQPIGDNFEASTFLLLEYPVGCWFCEAPPPTSIMLIELPEGKSFMLRRGLLKVEGKLKLNSTDPEDFLYSMKDVVIGEVD